MRLVRVTGAALVGMAVLAGCSDGGQASETLPSVSSSATETTESLPPLGPPDMPMPPEAREKTASAALLELEYFTSLLTHQANKSGQPLRDLSRDCSFCTLIADRIDADLAAGHQYLGGEISLSDLVTPAINDSVAEFAFSASQTEVRVLGASGSPVPGRGESAVSGVSGAAAMTWDPSLQAWLVTQLTFG